MAEECAKDPWDVPGEAPGIDAVKQRLRDVAAKKLRSAYAMRVKQDRQVAIAAVKDEAVAAFADDAGAAAQVSGLFKGLERDIVRGQILDTDRKRTRLNSSH